MSCLRWLVVLPSGEEEPHPTTGAELASDLSETQLDFVERETTRAQAEENDRDRGIHARLIALLGLSSLVTAVLAVFAALATAAQLDLTRLQLLMALVPLSYAALQAIASMHYTIRGLMPRSYSIAPPWGESQRGTEPPVWDRSVILALHRSNLRQSRWSTNRRADEMTLALESLRRFAWGSLIVLLMLVLVILDQEFGAISQILDVLQRMNE